MSDEAVSEKNTPEMENESKPSQETEMAPITTDQQVSNRRDSVEESAMNTEVYKFYWCNIVTIRKSSFIE